MLYLFGQRSRNKFDNALLTLTSCNKFIAHLLFFVISEVIKTMIITGNSWRLHEMIDKFFMNISNFNRKSLTEVQNIQVGKNIILFIIIQVMFVLRIILSMCLHVGLALNTGAYRGQRHQIPWDCTQVSCKICS